MGFRPGWRQRLRRGCARVNQGLDQTLDAFASFNHAAIFISGFWTSSEILFSYVLRLLRCCASTNGGQEYFQYAQDAAFGVVNRDDFEQHIQVHFLDAAADDGDAASYALRNAVFAIGCRQMSGADCTDSREVQEQSLGLFLNALSRFSDLLFMPSGLRAVQALVVMVRSFKVGSRCLFWFAERKNRPPLRNCLAAPRSSIRSLVRLPG